MKITVTIPDIHDKELMESAKKLGVGVNSYVASVIVDELEKKNTTLIMPDGVNTENLKDEFKFSFKIIDKIVEKTSIPYDVIKSRSRKRPVVTARYLAIYLINELTNNLQDYDIAKLFLRDRTSVLYAINEMSYKVKLFPEINKLYTELKNELNGN